MKGRARLGGRDAGAARSHSLRRTLRIDASPQLRNPVTLLRDRSDYFITSRPSNSVTVRPR
jgi:hypothetical protein